MGKRFFELPMGHDKVPRVKLSVEDFRLAYTCDVVVGNNVHVAAKRNAVLQGLVFVFLRIVYDRHR